MSLGTLKLTISLLFFFVMPTLRAESIEGNSVTIQILDKITAKVETIQVKVNESIKFESLIIEIYTCYKNPPEKVPENFVLLRIYDQINKLDQKLLYQGWMISSSPAITPLEHPIYDLWLKDCSIKTDF